MNHKLGFRRLTLLVCALLVGGGVFAGTAAAFDQTSQAFYEKHPMSADQVKKQWGKPTAVVKSAGDTEKLYYKLKDSFIVDTAYRFFVIKDGTVLYSGLSQTIDKTGDSKKPEQFPVSRLDQAYYKKNMVSVEKLEKVMGDPVVTKPIASGGLVYVYKMKTPWLVDTAYQYFIVKDGRVMGSGATDSIGETQIGGKGTTKPEYVTELSKIYYQKHPLSVADVDRVWGKPAAVKQLDVMTQERFYNNEAGTGVMQKYRYFVIENDAVIASGLSNTID
ncbi:MAG: hypothetical protein ABIL58_13155 [Pseudomonadota bacterium]